MAYWLIKSEPFKYSWDQFMRDGRTMWDGVRNYAARNNLREMREGDLAFFYHSNEGLEIVGIAEVVREHYPDPTADSDTWSVVDFRPRCPMKRPLTLQEIKGDDHLKDMELVRLSRLSVSRVSDAEAKHILKVTGTRLLK